ncbi:MAG: hypothetical protein F4Y53_06565 [Proteobacteria bacterium]|nr:hypothetical protein [Pseudomonadota bacterium]
MNPPIDGAGQLIQRASQDQGFRQRLLDDPKQAIEEALGVRLTADQQVFVHQASETEAHLVLPPMSKRTPAEREAARTGVASLEFLRKTLHDPAPPMRTPAPAKAVDLGASAKELVSAARTSIGRGLEFLQSSVGENGAWHCIRFNVADPEVPRHFERPAFVTAFCVLALQGCGDARAKALCEVSRAYLMDTMEYPGMWRYYRHLPRDLDSTTLCSLILGSHPWVALGRNVEKILSNRDEEGRFLTWVLGEDEPDVVSKFRIEADPVVNANVIAYLGDHPQTRPAQRWLEGLVRRDRVQGTSKWYPDTIAIYYAIARAMVRARPALESLRPILADRILGLRDAQGSFGNLLQSAQAVSALDNLQSLTHIDMKGELARLLGAQHEDGSWPELLAFGDQTLKWGVVGQFGHASESVTTAFCIEALGRLAQALHG